MIYIFSRVSSALTSVYSNMNKKTIIVSDMLETIYIHVAFKHGPD